MIGCKYVSVRVIWVVVVVFFSDENWIGGLILYCLEGNVVWVLFEECVVVKFFGFVVCLRLGVYFCYGNFGIFFLYVWLLCFGCWGIVM